MIRIIEERDAEALAEICQQALGHKTSAEVLLGNIGRLQMKPEYFIRVYEDDNGMIAGFIQAQRYDILYGEYGWNIIALAAAKSYQGKGVGRQLLESIEAQAMSDGSSFIRLNSRVERQEAHSFYEHMGYTCDKVQKRFMKYIGR